METNLQDFETEPTQRPSFLTVLCILTFIGSGFAILNSVWTYTSASKFTKEFVQFRHMDRDSSGIDSVHVNDSAAVKEARRSNELGEKMKKSISQIMSEDNMRKGAIGAFIAALFTLSGALLMWHLKRSGFYLYVLGVVIAGIIPFYLFGSNFLAVGMSSFGSFFGLVFIALYALNLKAMNR